MPSFDFIFDPAASSDLRFIKVEADTAEDAVEAAQKHLARQEGLNLIIVERDGIRVRTVRRTDQAAP